MPAVINKDGSATAYDLAVSPFTGWQHGRIDASAVAHVASFARRTCHLSGWVDISPFRDPTRTSFAVAHEVRVNPAYESRFIQVTDKCYAICTVSHVGNSSCSFLTKVYLAPKKVSNAQLSSSPAAEEKQSAALPPHFPTREHLAEKDYHDWILELGGGGADDVRRQVSNNSESTVDFYNTSDLPIELGMTTLTIVYISTETRKSTAIQPELRQLLLDGSRNKTLHDEWKSRGEANKNNDRLKINFDLIHASSETLFGALDSCVLSLASPHDSSAPTPTNAGGAGGNVNEARPTSPTTIIPVPITSGGTNTSSSNHNPVVIANAEEAQLVRSMGAQEDSAAVTEAQRRNGSPSGHPKGIISSLSLSPSPTKQEGERQIALHMAVFTNRRALRPADFDFNLHMNMNMYVSAVLDTLKYAMRDFLDLQRKQNAVAKQKLIQSDQQQGGGSDSSDHKRGTPIVPLTHQFPAVTVEVDTSTGKVLTTTEESDKDKVATSSAVSVHHLGEVLGRLGYQSVVSKFTNLIHSNRAHHHHRKQHAHSGDEQERTTEQEQQQKQQVQDDYLSRQTTNPEMEATDQTKPPTAAGAKKDAYDMTRFVSVEECVLSSRIEYHNEITELTSEIEVTVMIPPRFMIAAPDAATTTATKRRQYFSVDPDTLSISEANNSNSDAETVLPANTAIPIHYEVRCVPPPWVDSPAPYLASSGEIVLRPVRELAVFMPMAEASEKH